MQLRRREGCTPVCSVRYSNSSILCHPLSICKLISACRRASPLLVYSWTRKSACHSSHLVTFRPPLDLRYWGPYLKTGPVFRKSNCPPSDVCRGWTTAPLALVRLALWQLGGGWLWTAMHPDTGKCFRIPCGKTKKRDCGSYSQRVTPYTLIPI